jgi:hypothetical protein
MTHHLETEADVVRHFAEAHRVARRAALICDMHRNAFFYALLAATLTAMQLPAWLRQDGMVSVKRGWRVPEWQDFANRAGLPDARVWFEHGTRVLLCSRKDFGRATESGSITSAGVPLDSKAPTPELSAPSQGQAPVVGPR